MASAVDDNQHIVDDDEWDPMCQDFFDPTFNTYKVGPGARLDPDLQPWNPRISDEQGRYKLHVTNVPATMTEKGLLYMFLECRRPRSVYKCPAQPGAVSTWAFVYYDTHNEAEYAIRKVHGQPPLYLNVRFARSDAEKQRMRAAQEEDDRWKTSLASEPYLDANMWDGDDAGRLHGTGRGRGVPFARESSRPRWRTGSSWQQRPVYMYDDHCCTDAFFSDDTMDDYSLSSYDGTMDDEYAMIFRTCRITVNVRDGVRTFSKGRGYFPRDGNTRPVLGNPTPGDIVDLMDIANSPRMNRYEYGVLPELSEGPCTSCAKATTLCCALCRDWYCSNSCQIEDWRRHKHDCVVVPQLQDISKDQENDNSKSKQKSSSSDAESSRLSKSESSEAEGMSELKANQEQLTPSRATAKKSPSIASTCAVASNKNRKSYQRRSLEHCTSSQSHRSDVSQAGEHRKETNTRASRSQEWIVENSKQQGHKQNSAKKGKRNATKKDQQDSVKNRVIRCAKDLRTLVASSSESHLEDKIIPVAESNREVENKTGNENYVHEQSVVLPPGEFSEVKVCVQAGPTAYWVQLCSMESQFVSMTVMLNQCANNDTIKPEVGVMCARDYDGIWCRAIVMSLSPQVTIHYIDFGNDEVVDNIESLKCVPSSALEVPRQAVKVHLAPGTSHKWTNLPENSILKVKPIGTNENGIVVHVEGDRYDSSKAFFALLAEKSKVVEGEAGDEEEKKDTVKNVISIFESKVKTDAVGCNGKNAEDCVIFSTPGSVLSLLSANMCGYLQYQVCLDSNKFIATILCENFSAEYAKVLGQELGEYFVLHPDIPLYEPQGKELIAAEASGEEQWLRGYVISKNDDYYLVSYCDMGYMERVKRLKKLPEAFINIPCMAVHGCIIDFLKPKPDVEQQLKPGGRFQFEVMSISEKMVTILLKDLEVEHTLCTIKLNEWTPPFKHNLRTVELKDGPCLISVFHGPKDLYVRPLHKRSVIAFNCLVQDVNAHCYSIPSLVKVPMKGEVVACKYTEDGNYYRAVVVSIDDAKIQVFYIDFGNREWVCLNSVKPLTEKLKSHPCCAVKVMLNNILDKPFNKEAALFMSNLIAKEVELKLKLKDSKSKVVDLFMHDGTYVNDKINLLMEPSWKKALSGETPVDDGVVYMYREMEYEDLPVGKVIKFVVLHVVDHANIIGCLLNENILKYVQDTMLKQMNEYCNSTPQRSYVPRHGELCIAKFQGEWFRATCIENSKGKISVFFIDYGNIDVVDHTNIRRMVKDFAEIPAVACYCYIEGVPEKCTPELKFRMSQLVQMHSILLVEVMLKIDFANYKIQIPLVKETLTKEGLL